MSDLSIIIQGPLHRNSLANLANYRQYGPVIVATWETADTALRHQATTLCAQHSAQLVTLPGYTPAQLAGVYNSQNVYLQSLTTLAGLEQVQTAFAVKFRSDEVYTDLAPMRDLLLSDPARIWASSVYFRRDVQHKFHIGDHIVAGRTEILKAGFTHVRDTCRVMGAIAGPHQPFPEQLITRGLLLALGEVPDVTRSRSQVVSHFGVLSLKLFGKLSCHLHIHSGKVLRRRYIEFDDRTMINKTGVCAHDHVREI
jgi:hypothetical protein